MEKRANNFAFIDSQNLNRGTILMGWRLDFGRFRKYLSDKYSVSRAFVFIGYISSNARLYERLKNAGFVCIFKPTVISFDGAIKGNCDAELVLHSMIEYGNFDRAVIVTGDGDFYCLVEYLIREGKLETLMIPNRARFSALLKRGLCRPYLNYMDALKDKLRL